MIRLSIALLPLVSFSTLLTAQEWPDFLPPAASKVINLKECGVVGDGKTDDTVAIRKAIWANIDRSRYAAPVMLYLPAGTYRITGPIEGRAEDVNGWSAGWRAGFLLVGQARNKSILKLDNTCAGFTDAAAPKSVVATGSESDGNNNKSGGGNRAFRHCIANLTIDVGTGNPGANALDFITNNRGTVENVRLVAGKDSGGIGLVMDRNWPGPGLVKNLQVEGFATAISMNHHWEYSMTFEDIEITNPRSVAIFAKANPVFMRHLTYRGDAPVFQGRDGNGLLTLLDSTLTTSGAGSVAISTEGAAYIHNVTSTGFATIIDGPTGVKATDPKKAQKTVSWQHAQGQQTPTGDAPKWLDLPIEETPLWWPKADSDWIDGSADLQAAIDSGKPVVYIPNGGMDITKTIIVRGAVRKIVGFQSSLTAAKDLGDMIRIEDMDHPVIFEHLWLDGTVRHAGKGTVALRHVDFCHGPYLGSGPGKTFIEDALGQWEIGKDHHLWARQTNAEFGGKPLLVNNGGTAWILGYKTEGEMTCFKAVGGKTEILGALFYPLHDVNGSTPAIELSGGAQFAGAWRYSGRTYPLHVTVDGKEIARDNKRSWIWSTQDAATPTPPPTVATPAK